MFRDTENKMSRPLTIVYEDQIRAIAEISAISKVTSGKMKSLLGGDKSLYIKAIAYLIQRGYVFRDRHGPHLTDAGKSIALSLQLRHHLAEWMLYDIFDMDWCLLHENADLMEHSISPNLTSVLMEKYGDLLFCPHGNPITGYSPRQFKKFGWYCLTDTVPDGRPWEVAAVYENDIELLRYFSDLGILPGTELFSYNDGGPAVVCKNDKEEYQISRGAAAFVWLKRQNQKHPTYTVALQQSKA